MTDAKLIGKKLLDCDGGVIGTIDDLVVDPETLACAWVKVRFGFLRDRTLVPIRHINAHARRPATCVLTKDRVRGAPPFHDRDLDAATRHRLMCYYGINDPS